MASHTQLIQLCDKPSLKAQGLIGRQHAYGLGGQKLSRATLRYHCSHAAVPGRDDGRGNLIGHAEGGVEAGVRRGVDKHL